MNIIQCKDGKYASIDVSSIIRLRTMMIKNGSFPFKDESILLEFVPVIGFVVDKKLNRFPILINNNKHDYPVIYDLETDEWWCDDTSGKKTASLLKMIKQTIESDIEYRIENPDEGQI